MVSIALNPSFLQVRHPHCVQIMAASLDPSDPFIVMEWVAGGSWFDQLAEDPPPPAHERVKAVREASSALQYLHDPLIGIVHGDIKSLNLLIMRDGCSKVKGACAYLTQFLFILKILPQFCDFGGAVQVLSTMSSISSPGGGARVTTRAFCAPELFKGEPKTTATDMYAFGIMMWEFATCDVPFADNPELISDLVLRGVRPRIPSPRGL
jgi:serine/threonine protein kinase